MCGNCFRLFTVSGDDFRLCIVSDGGFRLFIICGDCFRPCIICGHCYRLCTKMDVHSMGERAETLKKLVAMFLQAPLQEGEKDTAVS